MMEVQKDQLQEDCPKDNLFPSFHCFSKQKTGFKIGSETGPLFLGVNVENHAMLLAVFNF